MSVLETSKSGANLASDRKVGFSRNLGCALADFYRHYSSWDLHVYLMIITDRCMCIEIEAECSIQAYGSCDKVLMREMRMEILIDVRDDM